jgi:DNA-binding CsgD family transcriptional regulator
MTIAIADSRDLLLPLVEGIRETSQWRQFMVNLLAQTNAWRGVLFIALASAPADTEPLILQIAAPRSVKEPAIDIEALTRLRLHPQGALRPGRVYAVDEVLDLDNPAQAADQRAALRDLGIPYGRWMRVSADNVADAWILLTREREDFSASAVATLSSVAPYLRAALRSWVAISQERLLRIMAQASLARLGVGQLALDETARVIVADAIAERHLNFVDTPDERPGRKLLLPPAGAAQLEQACAAFAQRRSDPALPVLIRLEEAATLMVQQASFAVLPGMMRPAATATLRLAVREEERSGAMVLQNEFRLSAREAALAEKLSRGESIVEAGRALRLTEETARNYSKRIYARTGSRGAPDLVRKVLTGLAPLA